jgi:glycosyltransferase involved in cell wall biosynthesis
MVATPDAEFVLVGDKAQLADYAGRENCTVVECTYDSFSPKELLRFPVKAVNTCDVFYTPNFNIPMGIRIPIYCTIHDIVFFDTEHFGSTLHRAALKWYVRRALRIAKGVFTVSQFSRQRIQDYFHTQRDIQVLCNGLSQELLEYKASHPVVQQRAGIVYLGNIKRNKGIHILWQAYQKLMDEGGNVPPLTIIGRFDFRTKDDEILQTVLANKDKVRLVTDATNQQVYDILAQAACLVSPSLYEGFGIPPLEAMSLGTPVILSDIPVYQEIYGNYPVTFFEAGNADELCRMLRTLPSSPIDVDELIASTYTYGKTAKKIMQALAGKAPDSAQSSGAF